MTNRTQITRGDIMPPADFAAIRAAKRTETMALKRHRRLEVGPFATCYFESYDTMWWQIHEMLHIEKGGDAQINDELEAYNPLIPIGRELVCTVMFEIENEDRRLTFLAGAGGIEETVFMRVAGEQIAGAPEADLDRTNADGKASSVQFVHFAFSDTAIAAFKQAGTEILVGFSHATYGHMAVMPETMRVALATDFAA
jgi:hypothetical protein